MRKRSRCAGHGDRAWRPTFRRGVDRPAPGLQAQETDTSVESCRRHIVVLTVTNRDNAMTTIRQDGPPVQILLVEDSPGDVRLTQEAFREADPSILLHVAYDGADAMAFLRQEGVHTDSPRPDLILLDLNLPKMDGREVLGLIKEDKSLKRIPTVILTTSNAESDVLTSYRLQANC